MPKHGPSSFRIDHFFFAMKPLSDTQNERDQRQVPIQQVGIKSLRHPILFQDKQKSAQPSIATFALTVDLDADTKGTHMSRFVEALHDCGNTMSVHDLEKLTQALLQRLPAQRAFVSQSFCFFLSKAAPVTQKIGLVDYQVRLDYSLTRDGQFSYQQCVEVPVATLCPCSKAISERGAHNQRGVVTFQITSSHPIWIEDMIAIVEASASCELYSVLKREDEKAVTERAYDNPVFVEDLVRNIAIRARAHQEITSFRIEAENFESIHNHSAYAVVEETKA